MSFPELVALEAKYCENKMFHESKSNCTIWRQTKDNKEKEVIQSYIDDSKKLESEFNLCVEKIRGLDYFDKKRTEIVNNYPCNQIQAAYNKLGYPYNHFKTPIKIEPAQNE